VKAIPHWRLASSILAICVLFMAAPSAGSRSALPGGYSRRTPSVASAQSGAPIPSSEYYGVVAHSFGDATPRLYGAMAAAGVRWAREAEAFDRSAVHLGPGQYDWNLPDYYVAEAVRNKIQLVGVLWVTPAWDSMLPPTDPRYWTTPPRSYKEWGDYVFQTVSRYKDRVHYWEVWNEEDIPTDGWWSGTAAEFTHLLAVAYAQVKRADPDAKVLIGGFMGGAFNDAIYDEGIQFIRDMLADQINPVADHFDIMNIHVYGTHAQIQSQMFEWWGILADAGLDDRPLWVTEFGWPSAGSIQQEDPEFCCGPEAQARYLATLLPEMLQLGASKVFWFAIWIENDPDLDQWRYFGLLDFLFQPTPAYNALRDLIASSPARALPPRKGSGISGGLWRRPRPATAPPANLAWTAHLRVAK